MTIRRIAIPLLVLPLLGVGCFRIGPRIAKSPQASPVATNATPATTPSDTPVLAYVDLNGGTAIVTRGSSSLPVEDGLELLQGDELDVTAGTVSLVYPNAGVSELEAGTKIAIIPDDGEGETGVFTQIRLIAGNVWTRFERVFGPTERFSVSANGVVATVRGTAFGVSVVGTEVDVQVADSEVLVTAEEEESATTSTPASNVIAIAAGQGFRATAKALTQLDPTRVKALVRKLSLTDREKRGFLFGSKKLSPERLTRPERPVRLPIRPVLKPELEARVQILRRRAMLQKLFPQFAAPLRAPIDFIVPTTTPSVSGPSATPLP